MSKGMTRDEQIENGARHYSIKASEDAWNRPDWEDVEWAFEVGAEWADANPNWHKYLDEKPTEEGRYLTCDIKNNIHVMWYNFDTEWYDYTPKIIIAWMELPQPPKFD